VKPRHRAMRPEDIRECVDIVASHPVIGPRYGAAIADLPEAWLRLLQCEAKAAMVFQVEEGSRAPICFFGTTAFVQDDFLREMKTPPLFWVGPELTRRIVSGTSPILTAKQLREANSLPGLNLVCWEGLVRPGYESHSELHHYMMSVFIQTHQGYYWKELIANQAESADRFGFFLKTGAGLWDPLSASYRPSPDEDPGEVIGRPHIIGKAREAETQVKWAGTWIGALFDYHSPKLGLSLSEQRLLASALTGATDEHLADMLRVSLPAVKKVWVSVYHRVEERLPRLIPDGFRPDPPAVSRGPEKRRGLLAYLREHPEELRPVSTKVLRAAAS
jgi:hypothetical protein